MPISLLPAIKNGAPFASNTANFVVSTSSPFSPNDQVKCPILTFLWNICVKARWQYGLAQSMSTTKASPIKMPIKAIQRAKNLRTILKGVKFVLRGTASPTNVSSAGKSLLIKQSHLFWKSVATLLTGVQRQIFCRLT
jgi:hypothetical protein